MNLDLALVEKLFTSIKIILIQGSYFYSTIPARKLREVETAASFRVRIEPGAEPARGLSDLTGATAAPSKEGARAPSPF